MLLLLNTACSQTLQTLPAANGLKGKVFCGYQGWYRTPTDGSGLGWEHYETYNEDFEPGQVGIDYWPDMSEATESEKFETPFKHKDGNSAYVYSSENSQTVDRHFRWMADYGIDGIFLQRFALDVVGFHHQSNLLKPSNNRVVENVRKAALHHKRAYAIMYDLSGMPHGEMHRVIDDWKDLNDSQDLLHSPAYLKDEGRPVVAIWGVGFSDNRKYTLKEVEQLMDFLKNDPKYGGCSILLGLPTHWRTLDRDALSDPELHTLIQKADVVLPWFVGRFGGLEAAARQESQAFIPDIKWCREHGLDYMPTIFPGFSWANRKASEQAKFDHIPREDGRFLWNQAVSAKRAGTDMVYIAMFDEMDEGTQIFKVTNDLPVGASHFLSYEPHEPDYYLRLAGAIGQLMNDEIPVTQSLPSNL
jgi:glycoprotein endo-alpha-1,2-mannosidase